MKTLDQWLEDSSSEDDDEQAQRAASIDGDPHSTSGSSFPNELRAISASHNSGGGASVSGSPVSAHTPTSMRPANHPHGGLYGRHEETREKMMRLLGADAVAKVISSTSSTASPNSPAWPVAAVPDRSRFLFGAAPASAPPVPQSSEIPPAMSGGNSTGTNPSSPIDALPQPLKTVTQTSTVTGSSQLPQVEKTTQGMNGNSAYEAVEVMVVDRGTQTVLTVGTQTDPLPMPYGAYYPGPFAPSPYTGWMPSRLPLSSYGVDVDGQPFRHSYHDYEQREAAEAAKLRGELEMIQNSIDMLIARYNLPPPPT
ncbi:hypothetical protein, conserved [Leishmania tarentolae]|uniref:Uncharacterized protein n=1 Tax=Leishmania tarentolae TaxID=5689 RepID=A0A640KP25_LEITA|nr:hypothetical protein, conserved [Leishmania tarentolae]